MNRFEIANSSKPSAQELRHLFLQTTWAADRSIEGIEILLEKLGVFVCVREDGQLVGFGRAVSDGVYRALIDDIVVSEKVRGEGLGKVIVKALLEELSSVEEVFLNTGDYLKGFYEMHDFKKFKGLTMVLTSQAAE